MSIIPAKDWTATSRERLESVAATYPPLGGEDWSEGQKQYFAFCSLLSQPTRKTLQEIGAGSEAATWRFMNGGNSAEIEVEREGLKLLFRVALSVVTLEAA